VQTVDFTTGQNFGEAQGTPFGRVEEFDSFGSAFFPTGCVLVGSAVTAGGSEIVPTCN
jgi:hypothetical protein